MVAIKDGPERDDVVWNLDLDSTGGARADVINKRIDSCRRF